MKKKKIINSLDTNSHQGSATSSGHSNDAPEDTMRSQKRYNNSMATILLVEERALDREYLISLLAKAGYMLLTASDGAEALVILHSNKTDLIITDIDIPGMDTMEFLNRLHMNTALAHIPIIFYTAAYREAEAKTIAQASGVRHVIVKTASADDVLNEVKSVLSEKHDMTSPVFAPTTHSSDTVSLITEKLSQKLDENIALYDALSQHAEKLEDEISVRRLVEESLRKREEQYRHLFEHSPNSQIIALEGRVVYANSRACQLLGAKNENELIGKTVDDLVHPDYIEIVKQRIKQITEGKPVPLIKEKLYRLDGSVIDVEVISSPCEFQGKIASQVVLNDITQHEMTEKYLAIQYAVTKLLIESSEIEEGIESLLQVICENLDWDLGQFWVLDREKNMLHCISCWSNNKIDVESFKKTSQETTLKIGALLPGLVWKTKEPYWLTDVTKDPRFTRAERAKKVNLHSGFGFPIYYKNDILGVIEFFTHEIRNEDPKFTSMFHAIGSQIGTTYAHRSEVERLKLTLKKMNQQNAYPKNIS